MKALFSVSAWSSAFLAIALQNMFASHAAGDDFRLRKVSEKKISDDRLVSGSMDGSANLWNLALQKKIVLPDETRGAVQSVVFFDNDQKIIIGRAFGSVVVFDVKAARRESVIQVLSDEISTGGINALMVAKQGRFAIAGGGTYRNPITGKKEFGAICLIDIESKKVLHTYETKSVVTTICETRDGSQIVVGERNGTISVWEVVK